jgi:hypothetical protein
LAHHIRNRFGTTVFYSHPAPYISLIILLTGLTSILTLFPPIYLRDMLDLVDIPMDGRYFIFILAVFDFVVSWGSEKLLFPFLATIVGSVIERARYTRLDEAEIDIPPARLAKLRKWRLNGKRYKIVNDHFAQYSGPNRRQGRAS